jgi:hypothetical protein
MNEQADQSNRWREECSYIAKQLELVIAGYTATDFSNPQVFKRYCEMQRNSAKREGFDEAAQYIQWCLDDLGDAL